ncbi:MULTISPECIES: rod shape-determining protein MreD [Mammaliicoccus]|uniref:Rod shape-determining protein MreD n=1 Tax=Mammaliicoccus fleurettii TaxID=150056 RepID=A0ABS5MR70_9STAP|nr:MULTISPECIES: rod shape-determining protein MreD [Mammaliicoccus]HCN61470.1 rod shape-determining protein MreD [Staphylococcus sp.]MBL0847656.1 rod shape-determining protein MreD [Mammaliicoccus fleurettii]MBO3062323.1 rod shape-determining protein MreD [Mammaliicoccus fleurettii]MBS3672855.1 rod shape-determining protein MreD [Mammaliicoccus fleurettii]MBS3697896.1 rod shape-determining protein MreD [Mammaliicoccus fleurettii]
MRFYVIPLIGVILFYLDIILTRLSPINVFNETFIVVPRLTFLYLLIIAVYKNPKVAIILAIVTGIFTDIYFGGIYGVYTFGYTIFVIMMDKLFKVFYRDILMMVILLICSVVLLEIWVMIFYGFLGIASINIIQIILFRFIPTVFFNLICLIIIFPFVLKLLERNTN